MQAKHTWPHRARRLAASFPAAGPHARRKGFSLAELLISIGILSIGLSMSAMLFPAALKENERSLNNVVGTLVCENTLALGKMILHADNTEKSLPLEVESTSLADRTSDLGNGKYYPYADTGSKLGSKLFARKVQEGGYQLVAVAYRLRKAAGNSVVLKSPVCTVNSGQVTVTSAGADLRLGSPVIHKDSGKFSRLVSVAATKKSGKLESQVTFTGECWVLQESDSATGLLDASPAMWTLSTKTGLRMLK